jgi:acetyltransferase-like isoleucine patch superfamily enzyme
MFFGSLPVTSVIRKPLFLSNPDRIFIGDRVTIREGSRLEVIMVGGLRSPSITIGADTNVEQNVHIVCQGTIRIGARCSITPNCSIVDVTHPYDDITDPVKVGSRLQDADAFVEIGEGTMLGIGVVVLPNVRIGRNCVIGTLSVVTEDIPDFSIAAGAPARVLRQYNHAEKKWVSV